MLITHGNVLMKLANNLNMASCYLFVGGARRSELVEKKTHNVGNSITCGYCTAAGSNMPGASSTAVTLLRHVVGEPLWEVIRRLGSG